MQVAQVFQLDAARARRDARRAGQIPGEVWAEVQAANALFEELRSQGQHVVFDDGRLNGSTVIALCDLEGRMLREVSAGEVVGSPAPIVPMRRPGDAA
ncbi:hypothetical protein [Paraconexibacter sp.]|uniref:hypothetical protein n=1 Tax=Paraconexibacter sp. TaxID=2949640 RepID=UPI0035652CFE